MLYFFFDQLSVDKILVDTVHLDELVVGAALLHLAILHHEDLIGVTDRAKSVRHDHHGLLPRADQLVQSLLNLVFALRVKGRRCLIKKEHLRLANEGTGDGDSLLLSTRELHATLTDQSFVAIGEQGSVVNEVVSTGLATGVIHSFVDFCLAFSLQVEAVKNVLGNSA